LAIEKKRIRRSILQPTTRRVIRSRRIHAATESCFRGRSAAVRGRGRIATGAYAERFGGFFFRARNRRIRRPFT
jgi:hypothetical protein